jgi:hypothetical protein
LKFLLLFNLFIGGLHAEVLVSSDRFILKILDRSLSVQDINYQLRNLKALNCIYSDAIVISYFEKRFLTDLDRFIGTFPQEDTQVIKYLHEHEEIMKKIRVLFKMLRYSEDQNKKVSVVLSQLIHEGTRENNCQKSILHKDSLKTNFKNLIELELYLRSRYEGQLRTHKKDFDFVRPSIDLFVESLDKQFVHEYFW